jgi:transcription initiation factor IIF auxiliary subunit
MKSSAMPRGGSLKITQHDKYEGDDWWSWSVWIDGSKEEIDQIKCVEYTLHSTFPNPVRTIATRRNNFKLTSSGWGEFTIYVRIVRKDESVLRLKHPLKLHYPENK